MPATKATKAAKPHSKKAASKPPEATEPKTDNPSPTPTPAPVVVDGTNRRSDDDALEGGFCTIVAGEYAGRLAAYVQTLDRDEDGYPTEALVRTRDADNLTLAVPYGDLRPAHTNGGR